MLRTCPRCGEEYGTEWRQGAERDILCRCQRRFIYAMILSFVVAITAGFIIGKAFPPHDRELPKKLYRESNSRARKTLVSVEEDHLRLVTGEVRGER